MFRPARLSISQSALSHNVKRVREFAPHAKIMAMVKANAYGHGILTVARALPAVDAFGVACLDEALVLRQAKVQQPLVLLEGFYGAAELAEIVKHDLDVVIHHSYQVDILEKTKVSKPIRIWLKVDTGMHRLGLQPDQLNSLWKRIQNCHWSKGKPYLMTHFADADELEKNTTRQQINQFVNLTKNTETIYSMANSAGVIAWPDSHTDWVRPGIMLYGISPFTNKSGADFNLKPVMTLSSSLIAIRELEKGDAVGYGGTWVCPDKRRIGVVAIGYGDGYPRSVKNGSPVLVHGKRVPVVGRVSMDMLTIDLATSPEAKIGDKVVLWGDGLPVEEIAIASGTIPYELLCQVTGRVQRCDEVKI